MSRPPILDPRAVPVVGVDAHLAPIDAQQLQPAALRARFTAPPIWQPEFTGDSATSEREPSAASVLIAMVMRPDGLSVLLTQRTDHLNDHAGQISFPGGRAEDGDRDATDTALREAEEEVGLDRAKVEVIGSLPPYTTVTRFVVTPVVGLVQPDFGVAADPFEVAEVFEVPLAFLMNPANHRRHDFEFAGGRRQFLSMPWRASEAGREYFIWGATASMLRNLYRFLAA
jgi:8-oxo-dGTP pyrophosphatase MutT (NUDIX family)